MSIDAKAVANYFLDLAATEGVALTPMKLQKLVYFAHGWHLGYTDKPLLNEVIQAWSFGPVIRSLYNEFREFGADPINRKAMESCPVEGPMGWELESYEPSIEDAKKDDTGFLKSLLKKVWEVYKNYSAVQLANLTHVTGSPWWRVNNRYSGQIPRYEVIPNETIGDYFRPLARPA